MTEPEAGQDAAAGTQPWRALAVCLTAGFMTLLDVSIVNVALPSIRVGLGAGDAALQWVVSGYSLTFGLLLVPAGRLGDARDRRKVFMLGVSGFVVASVACGLAPTPAWLVGARLVQGGAGGAVLPQVSGYIQESFQGKDRGRAFGIFGAVVGISTAVGPLLGGLLIELFGQHEGWRWVFYVNVPVGATAVVLAAKLLPKGRVRGRTRNARMDPVAVVLLGTGVTALLLPLIELRSWPVAALAGGFAAAAVLLTAFTLWEHRYQRRDPEAPLVALDLFAKPSYVFGSALAGCYFAGFTAIFFAVTLFLQSGEHESALVAGLTLTPFALGSAASAAVGGRIVHKFGRRMVVAGAATVVVGVLATAFAATQADQADMSAALTGPLLVAGLGSGLVISPNLTLTLSDVPVERAGSAGGVVQTIQRIGAALGIAAIGSVLFSRIAHAPHDWTGAFAASLCAVAVAVAAALLVGVADVVHDARRERKQEQEQQLGTADEEVTVRRRR
ncbi:MFS transporter [Streptacidiphilus neutrinimicus]|uniref:MFS transporter n=1 Tax=Streptacidiphilus neutrinimicus TaxID=105420 RepID=UPI0005AA67BC|nr:MFS transporter [Streptacidiphilus neutrinimicus]